MSFGKIILELVTVKRKKNNHLLENKVSEKDGGFVFQAILSHSVVWEIKDGHSNFNPKDTYAVLHQLDLFPDIKTISGDATLTYIILSEAAILKRKFDLASEIIKKTVNPKYGEEIEKLLTSSGNISTSDKIEINNKYFKNTYYSIKLTTNKIVFREVSTSSLSSGSPSITLKASTSLVESAFGKTVGTWSKFNLKIDGSSSLTIPGEKLSTMSAYDQIEKREDEIFKTLIPSVVLSFKADSVSVETYSNRSSGVAVIVDADYDSLFNKETKDLDKEKTETEKKI